MLEIFKSALNESRNFLPKYILLIINIIIYKKRKHSQFPSKQPLPVGALSCLLFLFLYHGCSYGLNK